MSECTFFFEITSAEFQAQQFTRVSVWVSRTKNEAEGPRCAVEERSQPFCSADAANSMDIILLLIRKCHVYHYNHSNTGFIHQRKVTDEILSHV